MRYAFLRRSVIEDTVWFAAANETEAWAKALDGEGAYAASDPVPGKPPIFRRTAKLDEYDL